MVWKVEGFVFGSHGGGVSAATSARKSSGLLTYCSKSSGLPDIGQQSMGEGNVFSRWGKGTCSVDGWGGVFKKRKNQKTGDQQCNKSNKNTEICAVLTQRQGFLTLL